MVSRFLLPLSLAVSLPLAAATFTVTSGADGGPGTLRQAILDANANPGRDQIVLQANVTTESSLPDITGPIDITGAGTPRFEINTNVNSFDVIRLHFAAGAAGSTVDSVVFGPFGNALRISTSNVTVTNVVVADNARVAVLGDDNTIGGPAPSDRNSFSRVDVFFGARNVFLGNTVTDLLFAVATDDLQVGTATTGNTLHTVRIHSSASPSIRNNTFSLQGDLALSTVTDATIVGNSITAEYGPAITMIESNGLISNNTLRAPTGVATDPDATGVEITRNDIVAPPLFTLFPGLAIDLNNDGPTPNDAAPDADIGGNSLQNFPVLTSATLIPGLLTVEGTLTSAPLTPYRIELFSNDAANPDARTFLADFMVTTDAAGQATFSQNIASPLPGGDEVITATATNKGTVAVAGSTPNSTSEVSAPLGVVVPGALGFAVAAQSVDENAGAVTITVTRTGGSDGTVTVDYATSNGTATAPRDYTATSGTLTFSPGVTEQTFTIPIFNDASSEPPESFTVTLGDPAGGAVITTGSATITIADDDLAAAQVPSLSTWGVIAMMLGLAWIGMRR